jgi:ASC-1-like (ASCH) protein
MYLANGNIITHRLYSPSSSKNWLELIRNGVKTIDNRSYDDKRRAMKVGDRIEFWNDTDASIMAEIIGFAVSDTFLNLYSIINPKDAGFDSAEEVQEVMSKFFSAEELARTGVVGIKIKLI